MIKAIRRTRSAHALLLVLGAAFGIPDEAAAQQVGSVELMELTIAQAHEAMLDGTLTARALTEAYLRRIDAYDRAGPHINALIMINPRALARAELEIGLRVVLERLRDLRPIAAPGPRGAVFRGPRQLRVAYRAR